MPNPFLLFLVLVLLAVGGTSRVYKVFSSDASNASSEIEKNDLAAEGAFNKVKENDIFHPKVITSLSEINHDDGFSNEGQDKVLSEEIAEEINEETEETEETNEDNVNIKEISKEDTVM